jgi:hypothetical protein
VVVVGWGGGEGRCCLYGGGGRLGFSLPPPLLHWGVLTASFVAELDLRFEVNFLSMDGL